MESNIPHLDPNSNEAFSLPNADLLDLFANGEIEIHGRMANSSNATLLVEVTDHTDRGEQRSHEAIYNPGQGERPLWDFPPDLYKREAAMFRLSEALGWSVVPVTVIADGPFGEGSVQAFVNADFDEHYFTLFEDGVGLDDLRQLCLLDLIGNNTDRKSGHCLLGRDGHVYGIDHGLAFHAQWKLRTVMWDFVSDPIPTSMLECIDRFVDAGPPDGLVELLDSFEIDAVMTRAKALLEAGQFPIDDTDGHRWPWPLV